MIGGAYRRRAGFILGGAIGLIYAILTQVSNLVLLPGIPLYQPPFGPLFNGMIITLIAVVLGGIAAWSHSSIEGVFASAVAGSLMVQISFMVTGKSGISIDANKIISALALFLPYAGMLVIVIGAFRWVANKLSEQHIDQEPWLHRSVRIIILVGLTGWLGLQWTLPPEARGLLVRMNGMVQTALASPASPPDDLQSIDNGRLSRLAGTPYSLQYDKNDLNRFNIPRISAGSWEESAVIARFENGAGLVCIFPTPSMPAECRLFDDLGQLN